jgi:hypothetical protein
VTWLWVFAAGWLSGGLFTLTLAVAVMGLSRRRDADA